MSNAFFDDLYERFSKGGPSGPCAHSGMGRTESPAIAAVAHMAHVAHPKVEKVGSEPGPAHEVDGIIEVLVTQVHRQLGPELVSLIRRTMHPMDQESRANLAAAIDDAFARHGTAKGREHATQVVKSHLYPLSLHEWLDWIAERCPINAEDRRYIENRILSLPQAKIATACHWYVQAWQKAAQEEPKPHRQENMGRRAANTALRCL